ncbi:PREDICTED: uncharacterized protein LOC109482740 [Branchiostoma belcheri]|uniref:Uncharacterized protein LOC109482740 n=1 Tax=Branchiostoma belcheri TaxID=7741 RepID=A0A6P5ACW0_BRABE|nr:PREDICTED: uncharacterized protein LOC109482740 [Branchiostoma belcheri]
MSKVTALRTRKWREDNLGASCLVCKKLQVFFKMSQEEKLTKEEKLRLIDQEINNLHDFCVKSGFSPEQIRSLSAPVVRRSARGWLKTWFWRLLKLSLLVTAAVVCYNWDPAYRKAAIYGKLALMKVLPYWDWTYLYNEECLINNPYYVQPPHLTQEDCEVCLEISGVKRMKNVDHADISDLLLDNEPFVVTDAQLDWTELNQITFHDFLKLFSTQEAFKTSGVCDFHSEDKTMTPRHPSVLPTATQGKADWYALWKNCEREGVRLMRKFYGTRPYFLPPMVESHESNWVFVSEGQIIKHFVPLPFEEHSVVWLAQVKGSVLYRLEPDSICEATCKHIDVTLKPGDTLVVPQNLWAVQLKNVKDSEPTVVIAATGVWD